MPVPAGHQVVKKAGATVVIIGGIKVGQFQIGPVMQAGPLGALPTNRRCQSPGSNPSAMPCAMPSTGLGCPSCAVPPPAVRPGTNKPTPKRELA